MNSSKGLALILSTLVSFGLMGCSKPQNLSVDEPVSKTDAASGMSVEGVRLIEISTPRGPFKVWTKKIGDNPRIKILLLHGGPGMTHEAYQVFEEFFPSEGFEYYYYDQLGSYFSDQPHDDSLWTLDRFVDEVEQVRIALGLDEKNFYLYGQSWGGLLAMEYALAHQQHIKGLIVSNMVSSIPSYARYAEEVLAPQLPPEVLAEIQQLEAAEDYDNPRYQSLLMEHFYTAHVLRRPLEQWPRAVNLSLEHVNPEVYVPMQGPSEFGTSGRLENWDRSTDLSKITLPTLVIGAKYDTMDPEHMRWMASQFPNGQFLYCPNGSHLAQYDDQTIYMNGLIGFIHAVDAETP